MKTIPFHSAESAFFWFMRSREGADVEPRDCHPVDIYNAMDDLYRRRILNIEHLRVLNAYGKRGRKPDMHISKENPAYHLWNEAMHRLGIALAERGIIQTRQIA
jgi:hypothetical protein